MYVGVPPVAARRVATLLILVSLLCSVPSLLVPDRAVAGTLQNRQDQLRGESSRLQQQLASARSSDAQIQQDVGRLDEIATTQRVAAAAAQTKLIDAQDQVQQLDQEVVTLTAQLGQAKSQVHSERMILRRQALNAYMSGSANSEIDTLFNSNAEKASVTDEYRSVAAGNVSETIGQLRQAQDAVSTHRADLTSALKQARVVLAAASAQAQAATAVAATSQQAASVQASAHAVLQGRIAAFAAESSDLASQQQQVAALIAQAASASPANTTPAPGSHAVGLTWPIHGSVTSEFGPRWGGFHPGIDIADPTGTPIHAAKGGQVIFAGWEGGYGNFVLIDHGGGIVTGYAHQSQIAVTQGQTVSQGQTIGSVGSTGDSTGPHLHFEVRINGAPQNPRSYVPGSP